ncbi:MAG: RNA polymerase sigma factor RpoD/SigA [Gemmatimonadetes bacterium]|nr:RNA polymerase sigma factor RpoD/SigA [Gemmatimonadota bacterium]
MVRLGTSSPGERSLDRYLLEISAFPLIDQEEEARLARAIREGDDLALDHLVRANLRFVVAVAKRYQNQGVPLSDLINEGNVGLLRAAVRFDETRGIKFISYAVWWIRQAILRALAEQARIVRMPINRAGTLFRIARRGAALSQELGREATPAEVAVDLGLDPGEVESQYTVARPHVSLNRRGGTGDGDDLPLAERLGAPDAETPEVRVEGLALRTGVARALETLTAREAKVLRLYYGLDGQEGLTLAQIGAEIGVTRERVRQIKEKALVRLRHASRARHLAAFHD